MLPTRPPPPMMVTFMEMKPSHFPKTSHPCTHAPVWARKSRRSASRCDRSLPRDAERPSVRAHAERGHEELVAGAVQACHHLLGDRLHELFQIAVGLAVAAGGAGVIFAAKRLGL